MDDVLVGSLMSAPVRTVTPNVSVQAAAQAMRNHEISSVVVVDEENQPRGILTSTDCVHVVADDASAVETDVEVYMSTDVGTTTVNHTIAEVAETMMDESIHHVPVVDDREGVVGMITTKDFAAYLSPQRAPSPPRSLEH